jgi:flagellar basal-body rod protein FlgB
MLASLLGDARIDFLQRALGGLARRQTALAGNIANVDTPGYRRRDAPFEAELRGALGTSSGPLATTSAGHIARPSSGTSLLGGTAPEGRTTAPRNDGNDVDIDYEMTQLAETSLKYQLLTQATSTRFTTLRDIVSRVS